MHCVRGHGELLKVLEELERSGSSLPKGINLHSWSGSKEMADCILRLKRLGPRIYFGFSATVNMRGLLPYAFKPNKDQTKTMWSPVRKGIIMRVLC